MVYATRRGFKSRRTRRWGNRTGFTLARRRTRTTRYGARRVARPRFALAGYARDTEKKYHDKSYEGQNVEVANGGAGGGDNRSKGYMYKSGAWFTYNFTGETGTQQQQSNDFNKGLPPGSTARSRIGNKITPIYYKGAFTFTAATVTTSETGTQHGETIIDTEEQYLRTTYRMAIVKDLQVNSDNTNVTWDTVFQNTDSLTGGVHSELNVDNMGRFIVLADKYFTVDATRPQKTCPFWISGSKMGNIRYNGGTANALTDKGIYVIYSAYVMGVYGIDSSAIALPPVVGNTRLCFTDS